jgi:plasmid maintenance system antidote protein VapI
MRPPIHPGEVLADELSEVNITPTELARRILQAKTALSLLKKIPAAPCC